ncbi:MAG TPA: RidA family protein [Candidatus Saccharimonadales bacterium]|nr:RidA family protein [Candidatus Saccharimonadales bacterium]
MIKPINTSKAPAAIGPYSQAIVANGFVFCSGQLGLDPQTGNLVEGIETQTHQIIKNLEAVLKEAGSDLKNIVKTTILLKNIADFPKVNEIYGSYFSETKPARATYEVANLPKDGLIEIEAIAVVSQ